MIAEAMHSESRTTEARPGLAPFPVEWRGAEDAGRHWVRQRAHFPAPVTPLFFSTADLLVGAGYRRAVAHYESAVVDRPIRRINTYFYAGLVPFGGRAAEQAARAQRNTAAIQKVMGRLEEFWTREWLPEIEYHLAIWDAFKLRRATLPALVNHLDETIIRGSRLWELHFLLTAPSGRPWPSLWRSIDRCVEPQMRRTLIACFRASTIRRSPWAAPSMS